MATEYKPAYARQYEGQDDIFIFIPFQQSFTMSINTVFEIGQFHEMMSALETAINW